LLYAFDLLVTIYEEAHADPESPKSEVTGRTLQEAYPTRKALHEALPSLILAHNLHGVDIDARCAQIAQFALWMRAQRAYRDFDIKREDRQPIRKSNIVVAEPLVTDDRLTEEFVARLGDEALGRVFRELVAALKLAGDLGILLRVEALLTRKAESG
ncbi:type II restriction enzyme, partial [mine drainage metagenome]